MEMLKEHEKIREMMRPSLTLIERQEQVFASTPSLTPSSIPTTVSIEQVAYIVAVTFCIGLSVGRFWRRLVNA